MQEWTKEHEILLLKQMSKRKPLGIHKHFRLIEIRNSLLKKFPTDMKQVIEKIEKFYNVDMIDNVLMEKRPNTIVSGSQKISMSEFSLDPEPLPKRSTRKRRESRTRKK